MAQVWVDRAAVAVYERRSLERLLSCREVPFTASRDGAEPAAADHERVLTILAEADDEDYWFAASRDGNRAAHYTGAPAAASPLLCPSNRGRPVVLRNACSPAPAYWLAQSG